MFKEFYTLMHIIMKILSNIIFNILYVVQFLINNFNFFLIPYLNFLNVAFLQATIRNNKDMTV